MTSRDKMLAVISELNNLIAEREDSIECSVIGLLTGKNVLKIGGTGQAKTFEVDELVKRIVGSTPFVYLMTKQSDEEQLFGRLDLGSLIPGNVAKNVMENDATYMHLLNHLETAKAECAADPGVMDKWRVLEDATQKMVTLRKALAEFHSNEPRVITTGKIPEAHIVFLDEIFKANEGILNSLLMVLNERKYTNEGFTTNIPTISFFAASNEIPDFTKQEDQILRPLFDRFDLKVYTEYIKNPDNLIRMMLRKQSEADEEINSTITLKELKDMQGEVASVTIPETITELMRDICLELRRDIHVSDRKIINFYPIAKAKAWLNKRDTVIASDLDIMKYYLWTTKEDIPIIQKVLDKYCSSPLQQTLNEIIDKADNSFKAFTANADAKLALAFKQFKKEMVRWYQMVTEMETAESSTDDKTSISKAIDDLEDISKTAHEKYKLTYAPLSRLIKLT